VRVPERTRVMGKEKRSTEEGNSWTKKLEGVDPYGGGLLALQKKKGGNEAHNSIRIGDQKKLPGKDPTERGKKGKRHNSSKARTLR